MPAPVPRPLPFPAPVDSARRAWLRLRGHAELHRGLWVSAPALWGAFSVFVNPVFGAAGFLVHVFLCLPRRPVAAIVLLLSGPLVALWFAHRAPLLTLPHIPFHSTFTEDSVIAPRTGVVASLPSHGASSASFLLRLRDPGGTLLRITVSDGIAPPWGATVRVTGRAILPAPALNPGQLDMRRVLRSQGAVAQVRTESVETLNPPPVWKSGLMRARTRLEASFERNVPSASRHLLEAALLNKTHGVPEATRDAFLHAGMRHILAISGLHIGLITAFLLFLFRLVRLPRKAAWIAAGVLAAAYIPLVGAPVSAVRAGLMLGFLIPAVLRERPASALHFLCLTLMLDLALDPHNILHLGFQLSYAATLGIILGAGPGSALAKKVRARHPLSSACVQMAFLGLVVFLFTFAPLAASTHAVTPWSFLGNVVAMPIGSAMITAGLCTWTLDLLSPPGFDAPAALAGRAAGLLALALEACVFTLAQLPGSLRALPAPSPVWLAAWAAATLVITALLRADRFRLGSLALLVLLAAEWVRPHASKPGTGEARATFLAVGHGDAIVVELPGRTVLIDAGDSPRTGRHVVLPYLRARGIRRIDAIIITHPHLDHYGGVSGLVGRIPIGMILSTADPDAPGVTWRCLRDLIRDHDIPWIEGRAGMRIHGSRSVFLHLIAPDAGMSRAGLNDRSLVALLRTPGGDLLFTGDLEAQGQRALGETWPLWRGAWLKAPHHGSDRTTLSCFTEAVTPPGSVISAGTRRGLPGPRTRTELERDGVPPALTSRDGAVTWGFRRSGVRTSAFLGM